MKVIVLGLGNILLRDEGVGVRVVEALAARYILPADVEVVDGGTAGMELLNTLAGCDHLLICDAVQTDAPPATVIELVNTEVPAFFQTTRFSPHQLGLADVLATLTLTDEAPRTVTLVGVVPLDLELGIDLSPEVAAVVDRVVDSLVAEMRGLGLTLKLQSPVLSSLSPTPLLHEKHSGCPAACGGGNE